MRFYPNDIPPFEHEPSMEDFSIEWIDERRGEGIRALKSFSIGEIVFAFQGIPNPTTTQYSLQISPTQHIHDPFFMGKTLHHCDPNCEVNMQEQYLYAIKPIHPGDLVTIDYEKTEDVLFKEFDCYCDAKHCRLRIVGRLKRKMLSPIVPYLNKSST